jgi:hypothetical protein
MFYMEMIEFEVCLASHHEITTTQAYSLQVEDTIFQVPKRHFFHHTDACSFELLLEITQLASSQPVKLPNTEANKFGSLLQYMYSP